MATSKSHFWLNQSTELVNIWICQQYWELIEAPKRIFPSTYFLGHFFTLKTIKIGDKSDLDVVILNVKWFNEPHYAPLVPPHLRQHLDTPGSPSDWRTSSPTGRSNLRQLSPALHRYLPTWAKIEHAAGTVQRMAMSPCLGTLHRQPCLGLRRDTSTKKRRGGGRKWF